MKKKKRSFSKVIFKNIDGLRFLKLKFKPALLAYEKHIADLSKKQRVMGALRLLNAINKISIEDAISDLNANRLDPLPRIQSLVKKFYPNGFPECK